MKMEGPCRQSSWGWLVLLAPVLLFVPVIQALDVDMPVEHSLGKEFSLAGNLQGSLFDLSSARGESLTLFRKKLARDEQEALASLVESGGTYKLRIAADPANKSGAKLVTSIPAQCLAAAGFQDHLQLHATPGGQFVGLNYDFGSHPCRPESRARLPADLDFEESSRVPIWLPTPAPVLRKLETGVGEVSEELDRRAAGKSRAGTAKKAAPGDQKPPPEDNRPWFVKNWMVAVPIAFVAINVLGQIMGPMDAPGAPAAAAAAPAAQRRR